VSSFGVRWRALSAPLKIGLAFAFAGGMLAGVGWFVNPQFAARTVVSFVLAVGISCVVWGVVAWAIATAALDVERDVEQSQDEQRPHNVK
jgi:hypothetical protein